MTTRYKKASEAEIQRQIAGDPDDFELTPDIATRGKPFREAHPKLAASIDRELARRGRPPLDNAKEAVTLRLDPSAIARFKAKGSDWRTKMAELIEKAS